MLIHKRIHIRLTSSFDKWLQMASIQGEFLSLQSEKIYFKFSNLFSFYSFLLTLSFHTKKWISVDFRVDCVAGFGVPVFCCTVSIWCFLADGHNPAVLPPDPRLTPRCCHYQRDILGQEQGHWMNIWRLMPTSALQCLFNGDDTERAGQPRESESTAEMEKRI